MGVFHIDTGHSGVSVDGDVDRDNCGLLMLRTFLERSFAVALQTNLLMTCPMAKGRTPPLGSEAGTIRAARYVPRISVGTSAVASLQKGFPHAITWVSVKFGHPSPMLVPSTTRSRGSVGGREFDGEQELAKETLLVFFSEWEGLGVTDLRFWARCRAWASFS